MGNHQHHESCQHNHKHKHGHSHHHHGAVGRMRFAFALNLVFALIELVGGFMTNSVAIMSDALHDLGDALALLVALGLEKFSHRTSDGQFSYGYRRFSTLGAVITGLILVMGSLFILVEAIPRLMAPEQTKTEGMIALAVLGVLVNGFAAWRVSKGESLNERMLMLHMIEDVMGWVLVLIGAVTMQFFDLPQIDAGLAIILSLWILFNVFRNLKEALKVFLMASPSGIEAEEVVAAIRGIRHVQDCHHAHLWSLDGEKHVFTAHVVLSPGVREEEVVQVKSEVKKLVQRYGIVEATIETELSGSLCVDPQHGSY